MVGGVVLRLLHRNYSTHLINFKYFLKNINILTTLFLLKLGSVNDLTNSSLKSDFPPINSSAKLLKFWEFIREFIMLSSEPIFLSILTFLQILSILNLCVNNFSLILA